MAGGEGMTDKQNFKVGDVVIVRSRAGVSIGTVERVTKTQVIMASGTKFRKDGSKITSSIWDWGSISHPESGEVEAIQIEEKAYKIVKEITNTAASGRKTYAERLEAIKKILEADND